MSPATPPRRIAIIGAGLAGLTAAQTLAEAGMRVSVFEKSRGLGGRLASRYPRGRDNSCVIDHGAPAAEADHPDSAAALAALGTPWPAFGRHLGPSPAPGPAVVSPLGASALARPLAQTPGVTVRTATEIAEIARGEEDFLLRGTTEADPPFGPFDAVISAAPAPQAARLLSGAAPASAFDAAMRPVLTVMALFDAPLSPPDAPPVLRPDGGALEIVLRDSAKPGRAARMGGAEAWVGHARLDWSVDALEKTKDQIAEALAPELAAALGGVSQTPVYLAGHRWRYAYATRAQGQAFWLSEDGRLGVCGDWRLGSTAGAAWRSGRALATRMAARLAAAAG